MTNNEIIAKHFADDPVGAVRAQAALEEILRAQADAQPYSDDEHTLMCAAENLRSVERNSDAAFRLASKLDDMRKRMAEASAPWLSEEVDRQNAGFDRCFEALGFPADHGFERSWSSLVLEIHRTLARSSAATVAEPSKGTPDAYPARLLHESDKSLAWRVDSWHKRHPQAAQQQAKPPEQTSEADDKPTERAEHVGIAPEHVGIQQAEPGTDERAAQSVDDLPRVVNSLGGFRGGFIAVHGRAPTEQEIWNGAVRSGLDRAAQSGQRAGVAEGWKVLPENPTMEMRRAGNERMEQLARSETPSLADRAFYVYKAMLDAAPTQQ